MSRRNSERDPKAARADKPRKRKASSTREPDAKPRKARSKPKGKSRSKGAEAAKTEEPARRRRTTTAERAAAKVAASQSEPVKTRRAEPPAAPARLALAGSGIAILIAVVALALSLSTRTDDRSSPPAGGYGGPAPAPTRPEQPTPPPEDPAPTAPDAPVAEPPTAEPAPAPASPFSDVGARERELLMFEPEGPTEAATVKQVIDGDTVILTDGRKVRLIGINTPERDEPLYKDASALTRTLIDGRDIVLSFDKDKQDQYKRSLAYIFVDGLFVNGEHIRRGLAYFYEFEPNTRHSKRLLELQRIARGARRGLWAKEVTPASLYLSHTRSHRYHREGCKRLRGSENLRFKDRNEALDTGRSPCPDCDS